ncbi:MAG: rhomboid family intramembrane serine protease [bacterium]|nr:rhomboid family intramembrane serine protease [bacterium]
MRLPPFPQHMRSQGMAQPLPEGTLVKIARGSREELENLSLLFASLAISHAMDRSSGSLLVAAENLERALYQWRLYAEENANWPVPDPEPLPSHATTPPTLLLMAFLALFYAHTGPWQATSPWFKFGAVNSQAMVAQHEWWRLITALTLHADFGHLIGNILVGGIVIHLLCKLTGYGVGWFLLLGSAALGNWCNVILRVSQHQSVGFSTAVFAAIGLLSGLQEQRSRWALFKLLVPIGAGIGLLAMLGTGGERTDLGAHLFGFVCGLVIGLLYRFSRLARLLHAPSLQHLAFLLASMVVVGAWFLAWQ